MLPAEKMKRFNDSLVGVPATPISWHHTPTSAAAANVGRDSDMSDAPNVTHVTQSVALHRHADLTQYRQDNITNVLIHQPGITMPEAAAAAVLVGEAMQNVARFTATETAATVAQQAEYLHAERLEQVQASLRSEADVRHKAALASAVEGVQANAAAAIDADRKRVEVVAREFEAATNDSARAAIEQQGKVADAATRESANLRSLIADHEPIHRDLVQREAKAQRDAARLQAQLTAAQQNSQEAADLIEAITLQAERAHQDTAVKEQAQERELLRLQEQTKEYEIAMNAMHQERVHQGMRAALSTVQTR
jgi:hypothetical protein